jgi:RNA polymerase sigma-70 factor, ECF subfamily
LHLMAGRMMRRERPGHTLQTTAVVHELYLRLCGSEPLQWQDRAHFFAIASRQFRRVLVDHVRRARRGKRGGDQWKVTLSGAETSAVGLNEELLIVDEALTRLEGLDQRLARVVELRFFAGLTEPEIAQVLGVSVATVHREWDFAKSWLASRLA